MFKDTINVTKLKAYHTQLAALQKGEAVQVLHRGSEPKVIITQEDFFALMSAMRMVNPDSIGEPVKVSDGTMKDRIIGLARKNVEIENDTDQ